MVAAILLALILVATMAYGDLAIVRDDYEAATGFYREKTTAHTESNEARFRLALALRLSRQRDEVIRIYTDILATHTPNVENKEMDNYLLSSTGCDLCITSASDNTEKTQLISQFKLEFEPKKDECAALNLAIPTNAAKEWVVAGYNDAGEFREVLIGDTEDELVMELKKADKANRDRLTMLATSNLDCTPPVRRRAEPGAFEPSQFKWITRLSYDQTTFSPHRDNWYEYLATIRHYWVQGSLGFEYRSAERFKKSDEAYALDAYLDLWPRAYVNLRYQFAPHHALYPNYSYRAELWQGLDNGWEPSVSYDHLQFGGNGVDMYGVGLGKYAGNWYLRWTTRFIPATTKLGVSHRALVRYYYQDDADNFVEVNGGFHTRGDFVRRTNTAVTTHGSSVGVVLQKYFTSHFGIQVLGSYRDEENSFVERRFRVGVLFRW